MSTKYFFKDLDELHQTIGSNVKRLRTKKGISQYELSLAIGQKSTTIISQAELGKNKHFNIKHLYHISKVLECDICEFFIKESQETEKNRPI